MSCMVRSLRKGNIKLLLSALPAGKKGASGFSLVEVMMIMALISTIIIPFIMLMTQVTMTSRGTYIQSTRSLVLNSLMDRMSAGRPDFYSVVHNTSNTKDTSISESGQVIPFLTKVDSSLSDSFKRTTYFYLYKNASDANTSPRYSSTLTQRTDSLFMVQSLWDGADRIPSDGTPAYNNDWGYWDTADEPGWDTYSPSYGWDDGYWDNVYVDYINVNSHSDDQLFDESEQAAWNAPLEYKFNVTNGAYYVVLYFSNRFFPYSGYTVNDTTSRVLTDIAIEGTTVKTAYSPYEAIRDIVTPSAVPTDTVSAIGFDASVTDGVLNVKLSQNGSSAYAPYLTAMSVTRRRSQ